MSELAGYYGGVTSVVCYILPWVSCIVLAIMLYRIIQVSLWNLSSFNLLTCIEVIVMLLNTKGKKGQHSLVFC